MIRLASYCAAMLRGGNSHAVATGGAPYDQPQSEQFDSANRIRRQVSRPDEHHPATVDISAPR